MTSNSFLVCRLSCLPRRGRRRAREGHALQDRHAPAAQARRRRGRRRVRCPPLAVHHIIISVRRCLFAYCKNKQLCPTKDTDGSSGFAASWAGLAHRAGLGAARGVGSQAARARAAAPAALAGNPAAHVGFSGPAPVSRRMPPIAVRRPRSRSMPHAARALGGGGLPAA